jgi:hypothetical protein
MYGYYVASLYLPTSQNGCAKQVANWIARPTAAWAPPGCKKSPPQRVEKWGSPGTDNAGEMSRNSRLDSSYDDIHIISYILI